MIVMKFGGTSVKGAERIRGAAAIIGDAYQKDKSLAVVLSAMKGVTDNLITAAKSAEAGEAEYKDLFTELMNRHETAVNDLLKGDACKTITETFSKLFAELEDVLHGIQLVRECSARSLDLVMSFGERLNCILMAAFLAEEGYPAVMVDAREIIQTDNVHGAAQVDFSVTYGKIRDRLSGGDSLPVITGFIGASSEGVTTTIGRNGSDYTAAIIGAGLDAEVIEIWTDVDGVMSADPRVISTAKIIPEVSIEEAMEMSFFGAEVIHPYTMIPAVEKHIPILIKNTFNPKAPGTYIREGIKPHERMITGIASIGGAALINVQGGGMLGMRGIASKVFGALARAEVNIIMISQASSEHSICIVCKEKEASRAIAALEKDLSQELAAKRIERFELMKDLEIVSIIGENMRGTPGISGKLFSALGDEGVNVLAIAQGSSERNISFVIGSKDTEKAIKRIHKTFLE